MPGRPLRAGYPRRCGQIARCCIATTPRSPVGGWWRSQGAGRGSPHPRLGSAKQGVAGRGSARLGTVWHGKAGRGVAGSPLGPWGAPTPEGSPLRAARPPVGNPANPLVGGPVVSPNCASTILKAKPTGHRWLIARPVFAVILGSWAGPQHSGKSISPSIEGRQPWL